MQEYVSAEKVRIGIMEEINSRYSFDCVMQGKGQTAPLFKCSATVKTNGVGWVLISYSTPIALYTPGDGIVWDCLRIKYGYTATSSQHLCKFVKWLEQKNFTVNAIKRFTR